MAGKGTDININRLHTNIALFRDKNTGGAVASLDAEKAFDSVEWDFLWQVLARLGFGPKFISWVQLIYMSSMAWVCSGGILFHLSRDTRQGCSLSPGLFALTIELMAILIRSMDEVGGLQVVLLVERISLYADNTLLYLGNESDSHGGTSD